MIHPPDDMVHPLNPVKVAVRVKDDFVRFVEFGLIGEATVSRVSHFSRADDGLDDARFFCDPADDVVVSIAENEIAIWSDGEAEGLIEFGFRCVFSISRIALFTRACDGMDGRGLAGEGDEQSE